MRLRRTKSHCGSPNLATGPEWSRHELPDRPAAQADARQAGDEDPRRRRLAVRAEVGRLPLHRLPRRRRHRAGQPQRAAVHPLLPRAARSAPRRRCPSGASSTARSSSPTTDGNGLDFDALQQRIHPAESRVRRLAAETPAVFVAFDLLGVGDESWLDRPFRERRAALARDRCGPTRPCTSPRRAPTRRWRRSGSRRSRAPGSTASSPSGSTTRTCPTSGRSSRSSTSATADCVRRRLPHPQGRRGRRLAAARPLRRRRASCTTSASRRPSPRQAPASCSPSSSR